MADSFFVLCVSRSYCVKNQVEDKVCNPTPCFETCCTLSWVTGTTVLGTPATTSYGLFHQPASGAEISRNVSKVATAGREPASTFSVTKPHWRTAGGETLASAAPAFEIAADYDGSDEAVNQHSSNLLERHTSAAKDGVIDMLTAKASKLGVSLERALLARKEAEDSAERLQARKGTYVHKNIFSRIYVYSSKMPPVPFFLSE